MVQFVGADISLSSMIQRPGSGADLSPVALDNLPAAPVEFIGAVAVFGTFCGFKPLR
jgi:hypothetical protein